MWYKDYFKRFLEEVKEKGVITFNSFDGKADIQGKDYLLQLTQEGYPVIPTVEHTEDLSRLGSADRFVVKLKEGADSIGFY